MPVFSCRDSILLEHPLNMQDVNHSIERRWLTFCSVFKVTLHLLLLQASELTPLILSNLRSSEAKTNPHPLLPPSPFTIQPFHYNCCLPPTAQLSLLFNSYNRDSHFKWRLWRFTNSPAALNTLIAVTLTDSKRSSGLFFFFFYEYVAAIGGGALDLFSQRLTQRWSNSLRTGSRHSDRWCITASGGIGSDHHISCLSSTWLLSLNKWNRGMERGCREAYESGDGSKRCLEKEMLKRGVALFLSPRTLFQLACCTDELNLNSCGLHPRQHLHTHTYRYIYTYARPHQGPPQLEVLRVKGWNSQR